MPFGPTLRTTLLPDPLVGTLVPTAIPVTTIATLAANPTTATTTTSDTTTLAPDTTSAISTSSRPISTCLHLFLPLAVQVPSFFQAIFPSLKKITCGGQKSPSVLVLPASPTAIDGQDPAAACVSNWVAIDGQDLVSTLLSC
jgi:hypothetical protein